MCEWLRSWHGASWVFVGVIAAFLGSAASSSAQQPDCNDPNPQTTRIQAMLDQGGTVVLQADNCLYGYRIDDTLHLKWSGTTLTSSSSYGYNALLIAVGSLSTPILTVDPGVSGYTISNLFLYGAKWDRTSVICYPGPPGSINLYLTGINWLVDNIESDTAPCQTSTVVDGSSSNFEIRNSWFANNGFEDCPPSHCWSDGLTVLSCPSGYIHDNHFIDNTDVDLIVGGGQNCRVQNNTINHYGTFGYAGLMLTYFGGGNGDHGGSLFSGNTISSSLNSLGVGIMVGLHPWTIAQDVINTGTVTANSASGATIGLLVEATKSNAVGTVAGNSLWGAQGTRLKDSCYPGTVPQNYAVWPPHSRGIGLDADWFDLHYDDAVCTPW
jgi:hypothetical protein